MTRQEQGTTLFSALLALVGVSVIVQLWLLATSVDAIFRKDAATPLHAAIASGVLFVINAALLTYLFSYDRRMRKV